MNLVDFFYAANGAKSADELTLSWLDFMGEFGLDRFTISELSTSADTGAHRLDLLVNYPAAWLEHYQANHYEKHDPVVRMGLHELQPFSWKAAVSQYHDRQGLLVMSEARDFGLLDGIGLSFRPATGRTSGIGFASSGPEIRCAPVDLRILYAASCEFYTTYEKLSGLSGMRVALSDREVEVLRWIAAGKTKSEVADILCVSGACVKRHCESAFRKLDVNSLAYAVARAIGLGLIDPP
jgi:DNA-binding CsgD family transcriptional regulator